jgi:hypothetical protein
MYRLNYYYYLIKNTNLEENLGRTQRNDQCPNMLDNIFSKFVLVLQK